MKYSIIVICSFLGLFSLMVSGQSNQNPKLKNTFKETKGQIVITDTWNELKISDKSIEDINILQKESNETKAVINQQEVKINSQQQQIDDLLKLLKKNQETIQSLERELTGLKSEIVDLKHKIR